MGNQISKETNKHSSTSVHKPVALCLTNLSRGRHQRADLVLAVQRYTRQHDNFQNLDKRQTRAIERWRTDDIFKFNTNHRTQYTDQVVLEASFLLFDDLFFGGNLHPYTKISVETEPNTRLRGLSHSIPVARSFKQYIATGRLKYGSRIQVWSKEGADSSEKLRMEGMLETLVHEMSHAFFNIYGCTESVCENVKKAWKCEGVTGHGVLWLDLQYAVYKMAKSKEVLNLDLWRLRCIDLLDELHHSRPDRGEVDLARWEINKHGLKTNNWRMADTYYWASGTED